MQGQVLYAPKLTPSQRDSYLAKQKRIANICTRAAPIEVKSPPVAPAEVIVKAKPTAPISTMPPIPDELLNQAWMQLTHRRNHRGELRLEVIKKAVCDYFGVSRLDIESARRTANVVRPRQIAMWLCRDLTTRSLPEIGRCFGGRDHTTGLHAIRTIDEKRAKSPEMQADIDAIRANLTGETVVVQP